MAGQADHSPGEESPQPGPSVPASLRTTLLPERVRGSVEWARAVAADRLDAMFADELADVPGGPDLGYVLEAAHESRCHEASLLEAVAACERVASWAQAKQAAYLQELGRRRRDRAAMSSALDVTEDSRADQAEAAEVGSRLAITPRAARARIDLADALDEFPMVHDALGSGRIDARKAEVLTQRPPGLGRGDHLHIVDTLLPWAPRLTVPALKRRIAKLVIEFAPETAHERQREAYTDRCVSLEAAGDGMAWLTAYLRADDAIAVRRTLDRLAGTTSRVERAGRRPSGSPDPTTARSLDQLRADAFVSAFERLGDDAGCGVSASGGSTAASARGGRAGPVRRRARHMAINLTVSAATVAGLDDSPAELAGYGAIPAPLAREILAEAASAHAVRDTPGPQIRYLTLDPNGQLTAPSTHAYRPGAQLTRAVTSQEQYCTFPGCGMPACYADLDHIEPYDTQRAQPGKDQAGEHQTRLANLQPLCRTHHHLKTRGLWTTRREADGTLTWTSTRTGHEYRHRGEPPPGAPPIPAPPPVASRAADRATSPPEAPSTSALPPAWSALAHPPGHTAMPGGARPPGIVTPRERVILDAPASREVQDLDPR
ncbi:HNH endonuclease signature motif containing protein [Bogoriella caseilytica]|nr:HNH endonuclease signature motif containing protein [Bogoriella caseilytica]